MPRFLMAREFWFGVLLGYFLWGLGGWGIVQDIAGRAGLHLGGNAGGYERSGDFRGGRSF